MTFLTKKIGCSHPSFTDKLKEKKILFGRQGLSLFVIPIICLFNRQRPVSNNLQHTTYQNLEKKCTFFCANKYICCMVA